MKRAFRCFCTLAFLCGFAVAARAQTNPASANLTASDTGACSTAGACLVVSLAQNAASSVVQLNGTFSATLQFEGSSQVGGTFVAVNAVPVGGTTAVTSATSTGAWRIAVAGLAQVRVRCSTYASGTVAVIITSSGGSSANNTSSGGGGGGTVTSVFGRTPVVTAQSGDYTASQVTGGGGLPQDAFYITTACGGKTNCLQLVDDDSTDNCGSPLTTFIAGINAYAGAGQPQLFIEGSGIGKAYKFLTAGCHLEFDIPTMIHNWATLDFAQPSGDNGIQFGATGQVSYSIAGTFKYTLDGSGTILGCVNLTTGCIHVEPQVVNSLITTQNFKNVGATNATLGSCTNYAIFIDSPVAESTVSYNQWQVTDSSNGRCAFANPSGSGTNTIYWIGNTIGGQSATNTSGCSSVGIVDGGSYGVSRDNNIYAFAVPIRLQNIGHTVDGGNIDTAGCIITGASGATAIQYGATGSSAAVGSFLIHGVKGQFAAGHNAGLFGLAHDSTATLHDVSLIANVNSFPTTGGSGNLIQGTTNCGVLSAGSPGNLCYEYVNMGLGGTVTCGSTNTGWQFENIYAGCSNGAQVANLGSTLLYTPGAVKAQQITCQIQLTTAATTSSTLPQCVISITDLFTSVVQTYTVTPAWGSGTPGCSGTTTNAVGNACSGVLTLGIPKNAVAVNYSTTNYASVGGTAMQYQIFVRATAQ